MASKEIENGNRRIVDFDNQRKTIIISNPDPRDVHESQPRQFTFDMVFDWNSTQESVFNSTALPIVNSVLEGYNGTIFAYGQTGTGKTFTMEGKNNPPEIRGIIPRSFHHIFETIDTLSHKQFLVRVSMLEIYNEQIRDLLSQNPKNRLELKENPDSGVFVKDLSDFVVNSSTQMLEILESGKRNRVVGSTDMNQDSSRSHCIFAIVIEASEMQEGDNQHITRGKLNLTDLAGSERQSKTNATDQRLKEACQINLSLACLGNVISSLVDGKSKHIPYRDSKLTRILQDSLGGNTRTVMCANLGPACINYDETISTLRYANRAKNIKNKPKINEDPKDAMLREFQEEIQKLRAELAAMGGGNINPELLEQLKNQYGGHNQNLVTNPKVNNEQMKELEDQLNKEKEEIRMKAERERRQIESQKQMAEEEKSKLLEKIKKKEEEEEKARYEQAELFKKLKNMENKVIKGTKAMEKAEQAEKKLKQTYEELAKQREKEEHLKNELEDKETKHLYLEKQYKTQEDEIKDKTNKLKKLWNKYNQVNQEMYDLREEFSREREEMAFNIRELNMELKLKNMILEYFIPYDEWLAIERRAVWSDEMDNWFIPKLELSGNMLKKQRPPSATGQNRPTTQFTKAQRDGGNPDPRFHGENILHTELDMPDRTTHDFDGEIHQQLVTKVQEDIGKVKEFQAQDQSIFKGKGPEKKQPTIKRPSTAKNKGNLINPNEDVVAKVEKERKEMMAKFPMKK